MKTVKQALLLLCTLALVGLGAAMPWLSAQMEDKRVNDLRDEFGLDDLSLILRRDSGAADTLRLLGWPHDTLPWGGKTALDPSDVERAAYDVSVQLVEAGLMDSKYGPLHLDDWIPMLVMSGDGTSSAIVWHCAWGEGRYFFFDDATGKLASGLFRRPGGMAVSAVNEQIDAWINFCRDYYGADLVDVCWEGDGAKLQAGGACILTFLSEQDQTFDIRLVFNERSIVFNGEYSPTDANSMSKG